MNENYYVYVYCDPRKYIKNGFLYGKYCFDFEPFYVGMGQRNRLYHHLSEARVKNSLKKGNKHKFFKIKDILLENKTPVIIKIKDKLNQRDAFDIEIEMIKSIGRSDENLGPLTNHTNGGDLGISLKGDKNPMFGKRGKNHPSSQWVRTTEYLQHLSESTRGEKNGMFGRTWTKKMKLDHSKKIKEKYCRLTEKEKQIRKDRAKTSWTPEKRLHHSNLFKGENNPRYKAIVSKQTRDKISKSHKGSWTDMKNPKAKVWKVIDPAGREYIVNGTLHKFCRDENIGCADALKQAGKQNRKVKRGLGKGWNAIEVK